MTLIRLDIDELRSEAREIGEASADMRRLAGEALDATAAAPTIEGQFGPEVRALGQELHAMYEGEAASLEERSQDLEAIAARFEAVEQELELRLGVITADVCALLEEHERRRRGRVRGLAMPAKGRGGGDGEDDEDEEDDDSLLEKFLKHMLEQFWKPSLAWMTLTDEAVARRLAALKNFGPFVLPLPWFRGLGPAPRVNFFDPNFIRGRMDDFAGPLMKSIEWDDAVRAIGRAGGDIAIAPAFAIGWGVTLLPEQIRNLKLGADWSEVKADLLVDSGGFLVGEGAGWAVGSFFVETGPSAIVAKLGADVLAGAAWDTYADIHDWREKLAEALRTSASGTGSGGTGPAMPGTPTPPPGRTEPPSIPSPSPAPHPNATSTPPPAGP